MARDPLGGLPIPAEADFAIVGTIDPDRRKPEGPFGDHLGYYSLTHDFPVLTRRPGLPPPRRDLAVHLGRPPAAGRHLVRRADPRADRPPRPDRPARDPRRPRRRRRGRPSAPPGDRQRALRPLRHRPASAGTSDLGQRHPRPGPDVAGQVPPDRREGGRPRPRHPRRPRFLRHVLERVDWATDLHFQTRTTMDTLDYSGHGLNQGSKVVIAAAGPTRRDLATELAARPPHARRVRDPRVALPGILAVRGRRSGGTRRRRPEPARFCAAIEADRGPASRWSWWSTTASSSPGPSATSSGPPSPGPTPRPTSTASGASRDRKHWGCTGPLVIDARVKPHHAPPLIDDPAIERRVDALAAPGGPLHGIY